MVNSRAQFNHELLRKSLKSARKALRLNMKYAGECCGIDPTRLTRLERGYNSTPDRHTRFTIHEVLSICLAFDLDIWTYVIQESKPEGSDSERRDRAWAEAQLAWQIVAELRSLLTKAMQRKLTPDEKKRVEKLNSCA